MSSVLELPVMFTMRLLAFLVFLLLVCSAAGEESLLGSIGPGFRTPIFWSKTPPEVPENVSAQSSERLPPPPFPPVGFTFVVMLIHAFCVHASHPGQG
jgi:hypothetical protein